MPTRSDTNAKEMIEVPTHLVRKIKPVQAKFAIGPDRLIARFCNGTPESRAIYRPCQVTPMRFTLTPSIQAQITCADSCRTAAAKILNNK